VNAHLGDPHGLPPSTGAPTLRFPASAAKFAYSPAHAAIGTVQPGEVFEVESVEGFASVFRAPSDFTPAAHAEATAGKWQVTGPIAVAGARAGDAVAVTIHAVEITTPGIVVFGSFAAEDPLAWWDDESACDAYEVRDGVVRFDEHTTLPVRPLVGCLATVPAEGEVHARLQGRYGGNVDCPAIGPGATVILPVAHDGAGLYFGDAKALMGDGEVVQPPEVGALITASARPLERPPALEWPRIETATELATLVSGAPLEWCARQAFRELLAWVESEYDLERRKAALLLAMVARCGIAQISNDELTASCTMPRSALAAYASA
jgi:acetamidase/formamidase